MLDECGIRTIEKTMEDVDATDLVGHQCLGPKHIAAPHA